MKALTLIRDLVYQLRVTESIRLSQTCLEMSLPYIRIHYGKQKQIRKVVWFESSCDFGRSSIYDFGLEPPYAFGGLEPPYAFGIDCGYGFSFGYTFGQGYGDGRGYGMSQGNGLENSFAYNLKFGNGNGREFPWKRS